VENPLLLDSEDLTHATLQHYYFWPPRLGARAVYIDEVTSLWR